MKSSNKLHLRHLFSLLMTFLLAFSTLKSQVANRSGEDSTIFISHTVFSPNHAYSSGRENWGIAVGDINKDGYIDVVSASQLDSRINVHLNDGKGNFSSKKSYAGGNFPRNICLFDANGDNWLDVAVVSIKDSKLSWLLNDGSGNFTNKKDVFTGLFPHDVIAGDVNQDGNTDLVTVTNGSNKVNIHFGDGTGNFAGATSLPTGNKPRSVELADINKDGIIDILTGSDDRLVNIHLGQGGGKFKPKTYLLSGQANWGLGVADFDKDGNPDVATADYIDNKLCVHLQKSNMKFERAACTPSGQYNFDLVIGDFDMDGDLDIVTASTRDEQINVHLNNGKGIFSEKKPIISGNWNSAIAAADFDGDKDLDIATASIKDSKINIHRNITIEPEKAATSTCIYGTVYDKETNLPLKAVVSVVGKDGLSVGNMITGEDGKYKLCGIPFAKGYHLKVRSRGFPKFDEEVDLPPELGKEGLKKDVYLEKIKSSFVYGKIIDAETKAPLEGASIAIKNKEGEVIAQLIADIGGNYRQELPFGDHYQLLVTMEKYNEKQALASVYPVHHPKGVEKNFELVKIKPKTTACLKGKVLDEKTKEVLPLATVAIMDESGNIVKQLKTNSEGHYEACIPFGKYDISAVKKGYMYKLEQAELTPEDVETGVEKDIELMKFEVGMKIVLKNIYYDVAKATLREESVAELDRLIQIMNENPTLVVEISGHTDSDGSDAYNERLSQDRAQSVVNYLLDAGITSERLVAKGYGEKDPIVPNDSKENKQLNRRTEFKVLAF